MAYAIRLNNATESRYSLYKGECLATVWAIAHFKCYLFGTQFTLINDHQLLKWLMESGKLMGKLARWVLILQEYDFQVVHRPGVANLDANALARRMILELDGMARLMRNGARLACIGLVVLVGCGL